LRIVHVSTLFSPFVGGLEIAVQKVAEEQAKFGHKVYVITSDAFAEDRPKVEEGIITVLRVRSWKNPYPYLIKPKEAPEEILREADIVFGWGHTYYFVYDILKKAKIKYKKPTVQYFIGVDYLKHHYNLLIKIIGYQYQKLLTKKFIKIINLALVTNEYEKRILKEKYNIDAVVVPHGIDEKYLKLPNMADIFREKYNIDGKIIAFIGRIHPTKGVELLINAFAQVVKKVPDTLLVIAGVGDEKYLRKCLKMASNLKIRERIKYIGRIPEEDKIALIDASEIIVLPTKHAGESYPLLVNEVLARRRRFIITRGSIASKWIEESGIGIVTDADPRSLAQAIVNELERGVTVTKNVKIPTWKDVASELLELIRCYELHYGTQTEQAFQAAR